ncbi:unnamed protein product [Amoebophrya sp. A120]|nr:unnamed protein product [Amoebophrya sp. A120]|eukprot:GSA120T00004368001.1
MPPNRGGGAGASKIDRKLGQKRLLKEYKMMQDMVKTKEDMNGIFAEPSPDNMFTWYFLFEPEQTPFSRGQYFGKVVLPEEYPFKPPELYMITPNGRFRVNTKICTSMSSFHPESWDSSWTVRTVLLGLLSFLYEQGNALGCMESTSSEKLRLAESSWAFNKKNRVAAELFGSRLHETNPKGPPPEAIPDKDEEPEVFKSSTNFLRDGLLAAFNRAGGARVAAALGRSEQKADGAGGQELSPDVQQLLAERERRAAALAGAPVKNNDGTQQKGPQGQRATLRRVDKEALAPGVDTTALRLRNKPAGHSTNGAEASGYSEKEDSNEKSSSSSTSASSSSAGANKSASEGASNSSNKGKARGKIDRDEEDAVNAPTPVGLEVLSPCGPGGTTRNKNTPPATPVQTRILVMVSVLLVSAVAALFYLKFTRAATSDFRSH